MKTTMKGPRLHFQLLLLLGWRWYPSIRVNVTYILSHYSRTESKQRKLEPHPAGASGAETRRKHSISAITTDHHIWCIRVTIGHFLDPQLIHSTDYILIEVLTTKYGADYYSYSRGLSRKRLSYCVIPVFISSSAMCFSRQPNTRAYY